MSSAGLRSVVRILGRQAQKWVCVTRNKTVRAVRRKADNKWQVGPSYFKWRVISVDSSLPSVGRSGRVDTLDQSLDYKKKDIVKGNKFANP